VAPSATLAGQTVARGAWAGLDRRPGRGPASRL